MGAVRVAVLDLFGRGGPHVEHTKTLGRFKIQKEEASSAGVRRIRAVLEPSAS